jgi:apolipoprotein N-acyltransferase
MTFFLDEENPYRRAIAQVTEPNRTQLLAGGPRAADGRHAVFFNTAFLLAPDGQIVSRYDKQRLLPFAESFPASIDLLRSRFGRVRQFSAGAPSQSLGTAAGRAGVLICNEGFYGDLAAERVRDGATWLVNLANDTWVSDDQFSEMALDMLRFRAIEVRRWAVRASTWGPSAVVDPFGNVTAASSPGSRTAFAANIEQLGGATPYVRLGDTFGLICVGAVVLALLRPVRPGRA